MDDSFFDHDHNGKLDAFESVMKYDMTERLMRDEPSSEGHSSSQKWGKGDFWPGFLKWMAIIIAGYAVIFLLARVLL